MAETRDFAPFERELSIGELFGKSWKILRSNYLRVLPIFLVAGLLNAAISAEFSPYTSTNALPTNLQNFASTDIVALGRATATLVSYTLLNFILSSFVLYFACGVAISTMDSNWKASQGQSIEESGYPKSNYLNLALTTLVASVLISLGLFLLIAGAIIIGVMFYLSLVASSLERKGAIQALGRSRHLVSGRLGKTFVLLAGTGLFVFFLTSFVATIASIPFQGSNFVFSIVDGFASAIFIPIIASSMLVLYYSNLTGEKTIEPLRSPYDSMKPAPLGKINSPGTRYCPHCGTTVTSEERFCHNCGHQQQA